MPESESRNLVLHLSDETANKIHAAIISLIHQESIFDKTDLESKLVENIAYDLTEERNVTLKEHPALIVLQFKTFIKNLLTENVEQALRACKDKLIEHSKSQDDIIELLSRYNRVSSTMQKGLVDFSIADMEINKIVNTVIYMVNNMDESELK